MTLPEGWDALTPTSAARLLAELRRELATDHSLATTALDAVARRGDRDDVLFRCTDEPDRYVVVHMTWSGRTEPDPRWPSIVFDGSLAQLD
jgi:hypothetical protein